MAKGLPWWSSGLDSTLPIQGAWVQSLVPGCTKLRVPMLQLRFSAAKSINLQKKKKKIEKKMAELDLESCQR